MIWDVNGFLRSAFVAAGWIVKYKVKEKKKQQVNMFWMFALG